MDPEYVGLIFLHVKQGAMLPLKDPVLRSKTVEINDRTKWLLKSPGAGDKWC